MDFNEQEYHQCGALGKKSWDKQRGCGLLLPRCKYTKGMFRNRSQRVAVCTACMKKHQCGCIGDAQWDKSRGCGLWLPKCSFPDIAWAEKSRRHAICKQCLGMT